MCRCVEEELKKRVKNIIKSNDLVLNNNFKITWKNNPIGNINSNMATQATIMSGELI